MSIIVPFPPSPAHRDPDACVPWCTDPITSESGHANGTAGVDSNGNTGHITGGTGTAGHRCRSTVHRIDCGLGGGQGPEPVTGVPGNTKLRAARVPTADAGIHLQAEHSPGEPPAYVLGLELGGTEAWVRLGRNDLRTLITAARTLLAQTPAA